MNESAHYHPVYGRLNVYSQDPVRTLFDPAVVATFFKLRDFGRRAMLRLDSIVQTGQMQFIVAAIMSRTEIEKQDFTVIKDANTLLRKMQEEQTDNYEDYSLVFNRLVVLMNLPESRAKTNGEARLVDPKGILKLLSNKRAKLKRCKDIDFSSRMKKQFYRIYQKSVKYVICIFSQNIPCTEENHDCAKLLDVFATCCHEELIVSSEFYYITTDYRRAWSIMKRNDNIFCLPPNLYCPVRKTDENIESYLLPYDEAEEPQCTRIRRRSRYINKAFNLTSNIYRTKRKQRKEFHRQNSDKLKYFSETL